VTARLTGIRLTAALALTLVGLQAGARAQQVLLPPTKARVTAAAAQAAAVSLLPAAATLAPGGTQQFIATVTGTTNTNVTWTATGGTISTTGKYVAGTSGGSFSVTATITGGTISATAPVTIIATAPTVTATTPAVGATNVSTTAAVTATFSDVMDATTFTAANVMLKLGATTIAASVTYAAATKTVTLQPAAPLTPSTTYMVTIKGGTGGVKSQSGTAMGLDKTWIFTTSASAPLAWSYLSDRSWTSMTNGWGPLEKDMSNGESAAGDGHTLTIKGVTYAKGLGGNAPSDVKYALNGACTTFLAAVGVDDDSPSGTVTFQVWTDGVKRFDSGRVTGGTAAQSVNVDVTGVTQLELIITDGGDGNASDHGDWADAKVGCAPDTTPPTVLSVIPPDATIGLTWTVNPVATFSEPISLSTINAATVMVMQGATTLPATLLYDATTSTLSIDPTPTLAASTSYTVTIKGGTNGVKDLAGNAMATDRVWTFTTAATSSALSDRSWTSMTNGYGPVELDHSNGESAAGDGHAITLNGVVYAKGLGTNAPSDVRYALNGGCSAFTAVVGVDDDTVNGSVVFQVLADGVKRFDSGTMTGSSANRSVYVNMTGAQELALIVTDAGDGNASDHADWADAQIGCSLPPPTVTAFNPAGGATGVALSSSLTATFSQAMGATSLNGATITLTPQGGSTPVAAIVSYDATSKAATLKPTLALAANTQYTATVKGGTAGVKDAQGTAMTADQVSTFTTNDGTPPTITSWSPANLATGVLVTADVQITFSEAMNAAKLSTTTVSLAQGAAAVPATVGYNAATKTVTLHPAAALATNTSYTATVKGGAAGVTDLSGTPLAQDQVLTFTTAADATAPTILSVSPSAGATGVLLTTDATVTFSKAMNAGTLTSTSLTLTQGSTSVPVTVSYNSATNTANVHPSALALSGTYTVKVKGGAGGVSDLTGNVLAADQSWTFTTTSDATPPTVTTIAPPAGATGVAVTANVTATFSEAMKAATLTATAVTLAGPTGTIAATVTYDSSQNIVTLHPLASLAFSTTYTATIKGGSAV
jgi:hypothetical protein